MRTYVFLVPLGILLVLSSACTTQQPQPAPHKESAPTAHVQGNLAQVMRGILFPNSNVIFAAQSTNPADLKPAGDPTTSTNPLTSSYGGWTAVENSALALAESANLLMIPGRRCVNGRAVPVQNADWGNFVQGLRDAGMTAFKAAQSKNQENIHAAADAVITACANCHYKFREKPRAIRCV